MDSSPDPVTIQGEVESFLRAARSPALLEDGAEPMPLQADNCTLDCQGGRLTLVAWENGRVTSRRILAIEERRPGRLTLTIARFANRRGQLVLYDAGRANSVSTERHAARLQGRDMLNRFLRRQFPGWRIRGLSVEPRLEHSLSPAYPRALVSQGSRGWAAIAALDSAHADGALTYGLIWLDYLRRRHHDLLIEGLALFLPLGAERVTSLRLTLLNPHAARFLVFAYTPGGYETSIDPRDHGNLDTHLDQQRGRPPDRPVNRDLPEAWLESKVRAQIEVIDPTLLTDPIYGQVPAFTGTDRGILDLLAVDRRGRLAVLELKASADPHLPLQALDYWMRVERHLLDGTFAAHGYFPGMRLSPDPPRLLLIAPALEFHSTTEILIRWISPRIEAERIGLDRNWRRRLRVVFRVAGFKRPGLGDTPVGSRV